MVLYEIQKNLPKMRSQGLIFISEIENSHVRQQFWTILKIKKRKKDRNPMAETKTFSNSTFCEKVAKGQEFEIKKNTSQ